MGRILIVDDEPNLLKSYKRIFRSTDYEISCVSSGEEALQKAIEFKPDIVLLDIMMPGLDGYSVCQKLKENEATRDTEVIFVSGKRMLDDRLKAYKVRASDFLTKPFSHDELLAKVEMIFERKRFYLELATTDALTKLGNRKYFDEKFENVYQIASQYNQVFTLAIIDIDHFKNINDSYGHDMGDFILESLSNRLSEKSRQSDILTRIGGEEFALLLPVTNSESARIVLERLKNEVADKEFKRNENDVALDVTISIGYTCYHEKIGSKDELFKRADEALYLAKQNGRNRVEFNK